VTEESIRRTMNSKQGKKATRVISMTSRNNSGYDVDGVNSRRCAIVRHTRSRFNPRAEWASERPVSAIHYRKKRLL